MTNLKSTVALMALAASSSGALAGITQTFTENFDGHTMVVGPGSVGTLAGAHSGPGTAFDSLSFTNAGNTVANTRLKNPWTAGLPGATSADTTDNWLQMVGPTALTTTFTAADRFQALIITFWASVGSSATKPTLVLDGVPNSPALAVLSGNFGNPNPDGNLYTFTFTGSFLAGLHTLVFSTDPNQASPQSGMRLDDLSASTFVSAPAPLALVSLGLAGLALMRRRRA